VEADKAIALNGQLANGYNLRGAIFRDKGEREKAIKDFTEAIRLRPEFVHPHSNRGMTKRATGDVDGAIDDLSEAIRLDPAFNFAYAQRGIAYADRGDIERARADFAAAMATPPKYLSGKRAQDIARSRLALLPTAAPTDNRADTANPPAPNPTGAVKRVALVIGNGRYANAPALPNPANDARAVAVALRNLGFEVVEGIDLNHAAMERLLQDYLRQSSSARVSLLFYAGHGMQVDGKNYLVPIDAKLAAPTDLNFETIDLDRLLSALDDETHANIVILDA
jgi:tetratricopeptide (TPR) repeat protein